MKILGFLLVAILMAGFSALPFYFTWWLPRRRSQAWIDAALSLGLRLEPPPTKYHPVYFGRMHGHRDGFAVGCETRSEGNSESTRYYTNVMVELPRSLDAHLDVRPVGGLGRMWTAVAGENDIQLGDPDLDPAFTIRGLDDRVQLLLEHSEVKEALRRHAKARFRLRLTDHRLFLEASGLRLKAEDLGPTIGAGIDLANKLLRAHDEAKTSPRWEVGFS